MAELGSFALVFAFLASLFAVFCFAGCGSKGHTSLLATARGALVVTFALVSIAMLALLVGLLGHDFSMEYVASYSSLSMSPAYLVSALWAGNSGSLMLWAWLLALAATVVIFNRRQERATIAWASAVLMFIDAFFLLLLVSVMGPFGKITPPADGQGLNPLLLNPGMVVHPPALLAGYVLLAVPFAFAVAALLTNRLDNAWALTARRWMLGAWLLLGAGNIIGAWWAYVELGWGGYWAWDPVENAGLMPWLVATAFLHSVMIQRQRGMMKVWTMVLVILAFILSIFGTYLTRSGALSSVHTFGDLQLGPFFIVFLLIMLVWPLYLVYEKRGALRSEAEMESLISRETSFLVTSVLLVGSALVILLGTMFPAISEALGGGRIAVGAAFFNQVNVPLFMALIVLAGICPLLGWQQVVLKKLGRDLIVPLAVAVAVAIITAVGGVGVWAGVAAYALAAFAVASVTIQWFAGTRARAAAQKGNYAVALWKQVAGNRARYGALLVHLSLAVMAIGMVGSSFYSRQAEGNLKAGQSLAVGDYSLTYQSSKIDHLPDQTVTRATLAVSRNGAPIATLLPEKSAHVNFNQPVTEVAIRSTLAEDLYVILGDPNPDGSVYFKVLLNPLVNWIWIGGVVLVLGGLLAYWPGREKTPAPESRPAGKGPAPAAKTGAALEDEIEAEVKRLRRRKRR